MRCIIKPFASNKEFYNYLLSLASKFRERGAEHFALAIESASRQASGMSTEFLGESRLVLRDLMAEENGTLTCDERNDLTDALSQLNDALDKR